MAPAFILGQHVRLRRPRRPDLPRAKTATPGVEYRDGMIWCPDEVWGSRAAAVSAASRAARNWFGQPRGLTILFLTNMWEQFSYFGMRALLVYYMTKTLLFGQEQVVAASTASTRPSPISRRSSAATIADRWLGKRRAVIIGASDHGRRPFHDGVRAGSSISRWRPSRSATACSCRRLPSQINDLYKADDPRRPWAYNVYYVGVNVGAFLAPLDLRDPRRDLRLALRLRRGRRRHARRPGHLPVRAALPARGAGLAAERRRAELPAARQRGRDTVCCCSASASPSPSSAAPTSRSATRSRCGCETTSTASIGGVEIGAAMFFSLNPLLVMVMTPVPARALEAPGRARAASFRRSRRWRSAR